MRGLKTIPLFLGLMLLVYVGVKFIDSNRDEVAVVFGKYQTAPTALGFVVLTSALVGMVVCGSLCTFEILSLYFQNRKLRGKLAELLQQQAKQKQDMAVTATPPAAEGVRT